MLLPGVVLSRSVSWPSFSVFCNGVYRSGQRSFSASVRVLALLSAVQPTLLCLYPQSVLFFLSHPPTACP